MDHCRRDRCLPREVMARGHSGWIPCPRVLAIRARAQTRGMGQVAQRGRRRAVSSHCHHPQRSAAWSQLESRIHWRGLGRSAQPGGRLAPSRPLGLRVQSHLGSCGPSRPLGNRTTIAAPACCLQFPLGRASCPARKRVAAALRTNSAWEAQAALAPTGLSHGLTCLGACYQCVGPRRRSCRRRPTPALSRGPCSAAAVCAPPLIRPMAAPSVAALTASPWRPS
mmetsp:Transcript_130263/g.278349  ORF Transcript_130263/g.278349 Transcript_130263/m.278349 type:complete len:224 (+) Transcript_130263:2337-3008(+)